MRKRILSLFGTRPEAIKMAPVIKKMETLECLESHICVTAQHREMLDHVLKVFEIKPNYDLNIMSSGQDLYDITTKAMAGIKNILFHDRPDLVLVQGDTTSAFIGALAAYYMKIPVGHIEAGLRTYDKFSPFPEEINRRLLSVLADYHFAPTAWAKSNLLQEKIPEEKIWITGNTVVDAIMLIVDRQKSAAQSNIWNKYFKETWNLTTFSEPKAHKTILVTGHRRENFGEKFKNICYALGEIAAKRKDTIIVYPVHLNPNVQRPVREILKGISNIHLIDPLEYEPFVFLMNNSFIILTDSGGIQEEAPSLGKPVLLMRDTTERPEGIKSGVVKLVGTDKDAIVNETLKLLDNKSIYETMTMPLNPYGDGRAAERIVNIILGMDTI
jgi:UDP-N-acetylglucosamine 2-epimerase (non-hydrolysing)